MKKLTIAQIGSFPISVDCIRGGVESSVYGVSKALSQTHNVHAYDVPRLGGEDKQENLNGIVVHRYENNGKRNMHARWRVKQVVEDILSINPDIVHIHGTNQYSYDIYCQLVEAGVKVMLTVHGLAHVEKRNALRKKKSLKTLFQYIVQSKTEYALLSKVPEIIVDTEYVANQIRACHAEGKIRRMPKMYVIPQGINEKYADLNSSCLSPLVFSLGAISKRKGHLLLVKAFEQLCVQIPDAKLIIAGIVAEQDYYDNLQQYIAQSKYADKIRLCINLSQDEIFQLYQDARIFALHSQEESQGIVFAEAMAVGLPIVSTKVGGIPYVVQDGMTGLLSSYEQVDAFAHNMSVLLQDKYLYQTMSMNCKLEAQQYLWNIIVERIEEIYSQYSKLS